VSRLRWLLALWRLFVVLGLVGLAVLPWAFCWALEAFGDRSWAVDVVEGLLVVVTSGVMLGILVVLARDSFGGGG
jgi:hypothetical protein